MHVGSVAQHVDHLEGAGLLALDAERVDRVDDRQRSPLTQLSDDPEGVVEVAADLEDAGAVDQGLGELAEGDVAVGDQHGAGEAGACRVGGGRGAGVAGAGAHHGLRPVLDGLGDGQGHAAVLERAGGVGPLDLEPDVGLQHLGQAVGAQQGRGALEQRHDLRGGRHGQERAVLLDQAPPGGSGHC